MVKMIPTRENFVSQLQNVAANAIAHCGVILEGDSLEFVTELSDVTINAMDWGRFSYNDEKDIYERFVDEFIAGVFMLPREGFALDVAMLNWENPRACRDRDLRYFMAMYPSIYQATLAAIANKIAMTIVNEIDDFVNETYDIYPSFEAFEFIPDPSEK